MSPEGLRVFGNRGNTSIDMEGEPEESRRVVREDVIVRIFNSVEFFEKQCVEKSIQGFRLFSVQMEDTGNSFQIYAVWMMRTPRELTPEKPFG